DLVQVVQGKAELVPGPVAQGQQVVHRVDVAGVLRGPGDQLPAPQGVVVLSIQQCAVLELEPGQPGATTLTVGLLGDRVDLRPEPQVVPVALQAHRDPVPEELQD